MASRCLRLSPWLRHWCPCQRTAGPLGSLSKPDPTSGDAQHGYRHAQHAHEDAVPEPPRRSEMQAVEPAGDGVAGAGSGSRFEAKKATVACVEVDLGPRESARDIEA